MNQQLEEIRNEFGIQQVKLVQPKLTTSFMQIKDANLRKEYEEKVNMIRAQRGRQRRGTEKPYVNYEQENRQPEDQKDLSSEKQQNFDFQSACKSQEKPDLRQNGASTTHNRSTSHFHKKTRTNSQVSFYSKRS